MSSLHLKFLVSFTSLIEQVSLYSIVKIKKPEITLINYLIILSCQKKNTRLRFRNTISVKSQSRSFFNEFRKRWTSFYYMPERIQPITIQESRCIFGFTSLFPSCIVGIEHFLWHGMKKGTKRSLMVYHGVSHLSLVFFSVVYRLSQRLVRAYTSDVWDF